MLCAAPVLVMNVPGCWIDAIRGAVVEPLRVVEADQVVGARAHDQHQMKFASITGENANGVGWSIGATQKRTGSIRTVLNVLKKPWS